MTITIRKGPARKTDASSLTLQQVEHLLYGLTLGPGPDFPFKSEAERRRLWFRHRDWLLDQRGEPDWETPKLKPGEIARGLIDYESEDD